MAFIEGVGGVFILARDPESLASWYRDNLGIETRPEKPGGRTFYASFAHRDVNDPETLWSTTWAIMPIKDDREGLPRTAQVNYRVSDLDLVMNHLRSRAVTIKGPEDFDYGRFAWCDDPEGNHVELFQETPSRVASDSP